MKIINLLKGYLLLLSLLAGIAMPLQAQDTLDNKEVNVALDSAEISPEYPGGVEALLKFVSEKLKYPKSAIKNDIEGRVIAQFIVNRYGDVVDIKIISSPDTSLSNEVIRVLKLMPRWRPGFTKGEPVSVFFQMPVDFQFENGRRKKKNRN